MKSIVLIFVFAWLLIAKVFSQKITTIPFEELYGGVIKIKATIGNYSDTLNFIFDTGSSHISLDSTKAALLQVPTQKTENYVNGIGGFKKANRTDFLSLHLPNLTLDSLQFNVNDYSILQESYGETIDGIIGYAFIHQYLLQVNFDSSIINVYQKGTTVKQPKNAYKWHFDLHGLPTTNINFKDGKKQQIPVYIDCGAGLATMFTEKYLSDSGFLQTNKKPIVIQIEGIAGTTTSRITYIKELKIGPYKFKNVPTYLYNDDTNLLQYPYSAGLIGNEILRKFNWWLDYSKEQIYLKPNKNFYEPFDYSYTGLSVFMVDNLVTITEVINNSPGQKAGFKKNDLLISIEDNIVTNVKQAKSLLQNARKVLKVVVMRNKEPITLYIKIQSII